MADDGGAERDGTVPRLVHETIDRAADRDPGRAALVLGDAVVSYGDLVDRSNQLANLLIDQGLQRGDRVGLFLNKSIETGVAAYGIMKSGGCFVPIDPNAPVERVRSIVTDCDLQVVISDSSKRAVLDELERQTGLRIVIGPEPAPDDSADLQTIPWSTVFTESTAAPDVNVEPDDLAYIMYTSGSTGTPKGMMHTHRSSLGFALWGVDFCELTSDDRVASHGPLHFDISIFDFFSTAAAGATVVLVPEPITKFPASLALLLEEQQVTALFTVPFALSQLELKGNLGQRRLDRLRWILFGGEPFPSRSLASLMARLPNASFANVFGPAEAPACVAHRVLTAPSPDDAIPIGTASVATDLMIVHPDTIDDAGDGPGELLVSARSITLGYWARPDRNQEVLVDIARSTGEPQRWFRTGDLVEHRADGLLYFLGRGDRMVKTRGFRVELDEIEAAMASHSSVEEAAAFTTTDADGVLVRAAYVPIAGSQISDRDLLDHLRRRLPVYALPVSIDAHESFPRTTSDKIDRLALSRDR